MGAENIDFYPDTAFIHDLARACPLPTRECLSSIYVTDVLAQGRPFVRRLLTPLAHVDIHMGEVQAPEEQTQIAQTISSVDELFYEKNFGAILAAARESGEPNEATIKRLSATWKEIKTDTDNNLVVGARAAREANSMDDLRILTIEEERELRLRFDPLLLYYRKHIKKLAHALLYLDAQRLHPRHTRKPPDTIQTMERPDSVFRGVVLEDSITGVPALEDAFSFIRAATLCGNYNYSLAVVKERWRYWHPGQAFYPPLYGAEYAELIEAGHAGVSRNILKGCLGWWKVRYKIR